MERTKRGRFARGASGNPAGRRRGSRNRATQAAEALLDGEAEALTRKAIDIALQGDARALRLCVERILPLKKGRHIHFEAADLDTSAGLRAATAALLQSVARGEITPEEASATVPLLELTWKSIEAAELLKRIEALEEAHANTRRGG